MNAITSALHTAGVKLPPLNKRIWLWLQDHPGKSSGEVAVALGVPHSNASSTLGIMVQRKMVIATRGRNHRNQDVLQYTTCLKKFELLPMPKKWSVSIPVDIPAPAPAPEAVKTPLEAIPAPLLKTLEQYKLSELRLIRDGLNFLFGDVK